MRQRQKHRQNLQNEALVTLKHQGQKNATGTGGNAGGSNGTAGGTGDGTGDIEEDEVNGTKTTTTVKAGTVDLRAVAELNGKSIYDVDPDSLEDRPWRKPGADLTDYFNYGFDESTWRMYCARQKQIREELSIKKRMNALESKGDLHELPTELQATSLGQASTSTGMPNSTPTLLPHGMPPGMMGLPPGMGIPGMPNLPFPPPPHIMAAVAARGGWQNPAGMNDNPTSGTTNTTSNNPNNPNDKQQASFRPPVFMPDMSGGMPPPFHSFLDLICNNSSSNSNNNLDLIKQMLMVTMLLIVVVVVVVAVVTHHLQHLIKLPDVLEVEDDHLYLIDPYLVVDLVMVWK
ncbi:Fip1 motif-domain-containing protein [Syncephalis plumigaleata]|nr:Fip1 motif-domain-containing protein [Syncephalis plumigaleata]